MTKQETKPDTATVDSLRPVGLTISSFFYAASGVYYLVYPLVSDPTLWFLYIIGSVSLLGSFGVLKRTRWGLWLGLALLGPQVIGPSWVIMAVLSEPGAFQQLVPIAFLASLFVLLFFACLTFLLVLDRRRSFK